MRAPPSAALYGTVNGWSISLPLDALGEMGRGPPIPDEPKWSAPGLRLGERNEIDMIFAGPKEWTTEVRTVAEMRDRREVALGVVC